ncbi:hypothetical protein C8Q80DRAFT_1113464, partial [Daedaleopsis nitida]
AWRFIIDRLVTIVAGAMSCWIIQTSPTRLDSQPPPERTVVIPQLQSDDQFSATGEDLK